MEHDGSISKDASEHEVLLKEKEERLRLVLGPAVISYIDAVGRIIVWERPNISLVVVIVINLLFGFATTWSLFGLIGLTGMIIIGIQLFEHFISSAHDTTLRSSSDEHSTDSDELVAKSRHIWEPMIDDEDNSRVVSIPVLARWWLRADEVIQKAIQLRTENHCKFLAVSISTLSCLAVVGIYLNGVFILYIMVMTVMTLPALQRYDVIRTLRTGYLAGNDWDQQQYIEQLINADRDEVVPDNDVEDFLVVRDDENCLESAVDNTIEPAFAPHELKSTPNIECLFTTSTPDMTEDSHIFTSATVCDISTDLHDSDLAPNENTAVEHQLIANPDLLAEFSFSCHDDTTENEDENNSNCPSRDFSFGDLSDLCTTADNNKVHLIESTIDTITPDITCDLDPSFTTSTTICEALVPAVSLVVGECCDKPLEPVALLYSDAPSSDIHEAVPPAADYFPRATTSSVDITSENNEGTSECIGSAKEIGGSDVDIEEGFEFLDRSELDAVDPESK